MAGRILMHTAQMMKDALKNDLCMTASEVKGEAQALLLCDYNFNIALQALDVQASTDIEHIAHAYELGLARVEHFLCGC